MTSGKQTKQPSLRKYILLFWGSFLASIAILLLLFMLVANGFFGKLPSFKELENPKSNLASEVLSSDQQLLGKYFTENRSRVTFEEISPNMINALIATEDKRFYSHSGIDAWSLGRVVWGVITGQSSKGGGSTLTQQLAKNLFPRKDLNKLELVIRKLKEWVIAVKLEKQYTKEEILTMYLNTFDFINNAVGIKSASQVYFSTSPDSLKVEQAAMLVGMAKNPALFNPVRRPDTTRHRRNVVFHQMVRNEMLTRSEYDSLKQMPIELHFSKVDHKRGLAPYFREILRAELKKIFNEKDESGEYLLKKPDGSPYNLYRDGLKVYTTIDSRMQEYAEKAVKKHLGEELQEDFFNDIRKRKNAPFDWRVSKSQINDIMNQAVKRTRRYRVLSGTECSNCGRRGDYVETVKENGSDYFQCNAEDCGVKRKAPPKDSIPIILEQPVKMTIFSWNGEIDTMMSPMDSIRYYKSFLQAGMMSMDPQTGFIKAWVGGIDKEHFSYDHVIQGRRQVGSTFKPFVYALAIQEGYSPCQIIPNVQTCFDLPEGDKWCPQNSDGSYGCNVSLKYGLANSMNTITAWVMKQFGPHAVVDFARKVGITSPMEPVPALCLGVADLSVYELVGANAAFANKGVWIEPVFITRIEDKDGNVIKEFFPKTVEAMSEQTAYVMLNLMQGVVDGVYNECMGRRDRVPMRNGTAIRLRFNNESRPYAGFDNPIAGKTGTTQNNSDGWFVGITPDLVTAVWVGAEDRSVHFSRTYYGQGANTSLPIWGYYMHQVYDDPRLKISKGDFEAPDKELTIELDCEKYNQSKKNPTFEDEPDWNN